MVKFQEIKSGEIKSDESLIASAPTPDKVLPQSPSLFFPLSSKLLATFRQPLATDLIQAEKDPLATESQNGVSVVTGNFYRNVGKITNISWGKSSGIPEEIKSVDDTSLIAFFVNLINIQYPKNFDDVGGFVEVESLAKETEAGDLLIPRQIALTNGDRVLFRQVLNKDIKQLEQFSRKNQLTSVEQYQKLATQTCIKINDISTDWAQAQGYFANLSAEDYVRVYLTLRSF